VDSERSRQAAGDDDREALAGNRERLRLDLHDDMACGAVLFKKRADSSLGTT
jgi:hypothetical protein